MSSKEYDPIVPWKRDAVIEDGRLFPQTKVLRSREGAEVRQWLVGAMGLSRDVPDRDLLDALYARARPLPSSVHMDEGRGVAEVLKEAGIMSDPVLILLPLEGAFDSGVRMARQDLIDFFEDLWFPSTDDLVVIDERGETLLLIDHHGRVGSLTLGRRPAERL